MEKVINWIIRIGGIVLTTVMSFVILPPAITVDENVGVYWKNIFAFFAGVLCLLFYDRYKNKPTGKSMVLLLLGTLLLLFISYELMYNNFSRDCFGKRIVVIHGEMNKDAALELIRWSKRSQDPMDDLIKDEGCTSLNIWPMAGLWPVYYGFITLYLAIISNIVWLFLILADLVLPAKPSINAIENES